MVWRKRSSCKGVKVKSYGSKSARKLFEEQLEEIKKRTKSSRRVSRVSPVSIRLRESLAKAKAENRKPPIERNEYGILVMGSVNSKGRKSMREQYLEEKEL